MVNKRFIFLLLILSFVLILTILIIKNQTIHTARSLDLAHKNAPDMRKEVIENKNLSIVAIGDSLTEGIGDSTTRGGYVYFLEQALKSQPSVRHVSIENLGVKGRRTDQLINHLGKERMSNAIKDADIVLITIGGNDLMKITKEHFTNLTKELFNKKQADFKANINRIFTIINEHNRDVDIFLVGMYNPFSEWLAELNELDEIVHEWNDTSLNVAVSFSNGYFIPIEDLFVGNTKKLLADDNFHPNEKGYQQIANRIITYLGYISFTKRNDKIGNIKVENEPGSNETEFGENYYMP